MHSDIAPRCHNRRSAQSYMSNIFDVSNQVALVTGASQGLGQRFAKVLASQGAKVCVAARNVGKLHAVVAEIEAAGGMAMAISMDVLSLQSIDAALSAIQVKFGAINTLVNNAGIAVTKPLLEQTEDDWDAVLGTNLKGAFLVAQAVARQMSKYGGGSIVNIASMLGYATIAQLTPYVASKGGLIQLTRNMALELARHGIRVNAIAPGYIGTELTREFFNTPTGQKVVAKIPQRRLGDTGDLDGPLLLLASNASRYMTGSVILVDGGFLLG